MIRALVAIVLLCALTGTPALGQPRSGAQENPNLPKALNVLLIGNSQLPTIVRNQLLETLAGSDKGERPIKVGRCINGGASLRSHWEAGTGPTTARGMIARGSWDFVILQDIYQVTRPALQRYARQFDELIKETGSKTVLFGTASILSDYPRGFERQHRLYFAMGKELGVPIVDGSYAFIRYFGATPSTKRLESLFAKDRAHPGLWGSYLYSCMIYSVLTERSPIGCAAPAAIPADVARTLQETAWVQHKETVASLKKYLRGVSTNVARAAQLHLFILSGQSNMVRLNPDISFTPTVKRLLAGDEVFVVKSAWGGQPIRRWYKRWKPARGDGPRADGALYDKLMTAIKEAVRGKKPDTVTLVWMQGERDANEGHGAVYAASLAGLISQLSDDLGCDDMNFVIGRLSDFGRYRDWEPVRKAQVAVAEASDRGAWVDTDDLNGPNNGLHYSKPGYKELGRRFAEKAVALVKKGQ